MAFTSGRDCIIRNSGSTLVGVTDGEALVIDDSDRVVFEKTSIKYQVDNNWT